jgi:hypothetical protein
MLEVSGLELPNGAGPDFWDTRLPDVALEALVAGHPLVGSFDTLVMDEAQDILFPPYLHFLDLLLAKGFAMSRLALFGDLQRQAIFRRSHEDPSLVLERWFDQIIRFPLRVNCRNTPRIGAYITQLTGSGQLYRSYRRPDDGVEPDLAIWTNPDDQDDKLQSWLERLRGSGYQPAEIVVLSTNSSSPAASKLPEPWRSRIKPLDQAQPGHGRYTTIASFKGLEAPAVVLTDIDDLSTEDHESLLYVGLSRATDRLVILASASARGDLLRMVLGSGV